MAELPCLLCSSLLTCLLEDILIKQDEFICKVFRGNIVVEGLSAVLF